MIVHNGNIVVNNGRWIVPELMKYKVNLIQTEGGTISAVPVTGINGTTVTLSNTPLNIEYTLDSYSVTGSTLYDGNKFKFNNSDVYVTATWNYTPVTVPWDTVEIGGQLWSKDISINDGGTGIVTRNNKTYYTYDAACRISEYVRVNYPGWHLPTRDDWQGLFILANGDPYNGPSFATTLRSTTGWEYSNGTDLYGFNMTCNGYYGMNNGKYQWITNRTAYWALDIPGDQVPDQIGNYYYYTDTSYSGNYIIECGYFFTINENIKCNIRLVKDMK